MSHDHPEWMMAQTIATGPNDTIVDANPQPTQQLGSRRSHAGAATLPELGALMGEGRVVKSERGYRYVPESVLGEGGMGEVLLVRDNDIDRQVAMKRLKANENPTALMRFIEEVRTIGKLEHPGIIPIHDVGVDEDGSYFFIMKCVEGETLYDIIQRLAAGDQAYHARFPFEVRVRIFLEILNAIDFAHSHGYIHRDIKPENIMIGPYGEVMVMDWGLAKSISDEPRDDAELPAATEAMLATSADLLAFDETQVAEVDDRTTRFRLTRQGDLLGTPAYMAPEQALGENDMVDHRTDVYALGVLFHELLTLEHYLADRTDMLSLLFGVSHHNINPYKAKAHPSQGMVPAEYFRVCMHAMQKQRGARYQSTRELIDAVHLAQEGKFPCECPVTLARRANNEVVELMSNRPMLLIGAMVIGPFALCALLILGVIGLSSLVG